MRACVSQRTANARAADARTLLGTCRHTQVEELRSRMSPQTLAFLANRSKRAAATAPSAPAAAAAAVAAAPAGQAALQSGAMPAAAGAQPAACTAAPPQPFPGTTPAPAPEAASTAAAAAAAAAPGALSAQGLAGAAGTPGALATAAEAAVVPRARGGAGHAPGQASGTPSHKLAPGFLLRGQARPVPAASGAGAGAGAGAAGVRPPCLSNSSLCAPFGGDGRIRAQQLQDGWGLGHREGEGDEEQAKPEQELWQQQQQQQQQQGGQQAVDPRLVARLRFGLGGEVVGVQAEDEVWTEQAMLQRDQLRQVCIYVWRGSVRMLHLRLDGGKERGRGGRGKKEARVCARRAHAACDMHLLLEEKDETCAYDCREGFCAELVPGGSSPSGLSARSVSLGMWFYGMVVKVPWSHVKAMHVLRVVCASSSF